MSEMVFARVEPSLKKAAEKCAKADDRKTSYIVRMALIEYLKQRGFLPAEFHAPPSREDDKDK